MQKEPRMRTNRLELKVRKAGLVGWWGVGMGWVKADYQPTYNIL